MLTATQIARVIRRYLLQNPDMTEFQARQIWKGLVGSPLPVIKPKIVKGWDGWRVFYAIRSRDLGSYRLDMHLFPNWTQAARWARMAPR